MLVVWLDEGTKTFWSGLGKDSILVAINSWRWKCPDVFIDTHGGVSLKTPSGYVLKNVGSSLIKNGFWFSVAEPLWHHHPPPSPDMSSPYFLLF